MKQGQQLEMTSSMKRDIMWNIIEPGDPYDIRKSMIAKLPGIRKPMGPHLEIVCLMQAAEIERLCGYLQEYKMKFKQNARVELDRHSYEIQIKQLTEKVAEDSNYRVQIDKLKEFVRKQSKQLEDVQRSQFNSEIQKKYEDSLRQLEVVRQQNQQLRDIITTLQEQRSKGKDSQRLTQSKQKKLTEQNMRLLKQLQQLKVSLQTNVKQCEQLNNNCKSLESYNQQHKHTLKQYQNRFQLLAQQIDRLNNLLRDKSRQLSEQYNRGKIVSDQKNAKEQKLNQQDQKIKHLEETIVNLEKKHRQNLKSLSNLEQNKILVQNYEGHLQKLSLEVDRLNTVLRKKLIQLEETKKKCSQYQYKIKDYQNIERENQDIRIRYAEINKQISEYQKLIAYERQQNDRLDYSIKRMIQELNQSQLKLKSNDKELDNMHRMIKELQSDVKYEKEQNAAKQSEIGKILKEYDALESQLKQWEQRENEQIQFVSNSVNKYKEEINKLSRTLSKKDEELQYFRNSLNSGVGNVKQTQSLIQSDSGYIQSLTGQIHHLQTEVKRLNSQLLNQNKKQSIFIQKQTMEGSPKRENNSIQQLSKQFEQIQRLSKLLQIKQQQNIKLKKVVDESHRLSLQNVQMTHSEYFKTSPSRSKSQKKQQSSEIDIKKRNRLLQRKFSQLQDINKILQTKLTSQSEQWMHLQRENELVNEQLVEMKSILNKYQKKLDELVLEIDRLNAILLNKSKETENRGSQIQKLKQLNGEMADKFQYLIAQNEGNKIKIYNVTEEKEKLEQDLQMKVQHLHQQNYYLQNQLDNFKKQNGDDAVGKLSEIRIQNIKLSEQVQKGLWESNQTHNQIIGLKNQNMKFWNDLDSLKTENTLIKNENADFKNKLFESAQKLKQLQFLKNESVQMKKKLSQTGDYYNKILLFNQEVNRLNRLLQHSEQQNQQLHKMYTESQQNIQKLKLGIESGNNQKEQTIKIVEFEHQINGFKKNIKELNQQLSNKNNDIQFLQNKLKEQGKQDEQFRQKMQIIQTYQSKINMFGLEIERLNFALKSTVEQSQRIKQHNEELTANNNQLSKIARQSSRIKANLNQFQGKIVLFSQEIQRLNQILRSKNKTIQRLENDYNQAKETNEHQIMEYSTIIKQNNQKISLLNNQVLELSKILQIKEMSIKTLSEYDAKILELMNEIDRLNKLLMKTNKQLQELQNRDGGYLTELERLNNMLKLKVEECANWQEQELKWKQNLQRSQENCRQRNQEIESITFKYNVLGEQSGTRKAQLVQYEVRIKQLYEEFQRLQIIIRSLKSQNQEKMNSNNNSLIEKNRILAAQIQRLRVIVQRQKIQLSEKRLQLAGDNSLSKRLNQDLGLMVILFAQIQSLRIRLSQQQQQMEQVRRSSIAPCIV